MTDTPTDINALMEVGVGPNSPTHSVVLIKENGPEEIKNGLGIADALRVACLQSRDLGGYAQVKYKNTIMALYFKGTFIEVKNEVAHDKRAHREGMNTLTLSSDPEPEEKGNYND